MLRSLSVGAIGENTENRFLQLESGSFRWWSELRPINVFRIGRRAQQVLPSFTGDQWWELGHSQGCACRFFQRVCSGGHEDVFSGGQPGNQLVFRLMRDGSPTLEQPSSSLPCYGGRLVAHDVFFKFVTVPVSASYSRVRLTTLSNCSTL